MIRLVCMFSTQRPSEPTTSELRSTPVSPAFCLTGRLGSANRWQLAHFKHTLKQTAGQLSLCHFL